MRPSQGRDSLGHQPPVEGTGKDQGLPCCTFVRVGSKNSGSFPTLFRLSGISKTKSVIQAII